MILTERSLHCSTSLPSQVRMRKDHSTLAVMIISCAPNETLTRYWSGNVGDKFFGSDNFLPLSCLC